MEGATYLLDILCSVKYVGYFMFSKSTVINGNALWNGEDIPMEYVTSRHNVLLIFNAIIILIYNCSEGYFVNHFSFMLCYKENQL